MIGYTVRLNSNSVRSVIGIAMLASTLVTHLPAAAEGPTPQPQSQGRCEYIIRLLRERNGFLRRRAIQEAAALTTDFMRLFPAIFLAFETPDYDQQRLAILRLLQLSQREEVCKASIMALEDAFGRGGSHAPPACLLAALVRMPEQARPLLPRLVALTRLERIKPETLCLLRVTSWWLDPGRKSDSLARPIEFLQDGPMERDTMLSYLAMAPGAIAPDRQLLLPLCGNLTQHGDTYALAVMAMAICYPSELADRRGELENRCDELMSRRADRVAACMIRFSIARASDRDEDYEQALAISVFSGEDDRFGLIEHGDTAGLVWISDVLITDDRVPRITRFLKSTRPEIRAGTLNVLRFLGRRAAKASDDLMQLVQTDPVPEIRRLAALAIISVADEACLRAIPKTAPAWNAVLTDYDRRVIDRIVETK